MARKGRSVKTRRHPPVRWWGVALLPLLVFGGCEDSGVPIVPFDEMFVLQEELILQGLPDSPIALAVDMVRTPDGSIVLTDMGGADLKVFSAKGRRIATLGRGGEGPGEFQLPRQTRVFDLDGAPALEVLETSRATLVRYRPDGTYLGTVRIHDEEGSPVRGLLVSQCEWGDRRWISGSYIVRSTPRPTEANSAVEFTAIEITDDGEVLKFMGPRAEDLGGQPAPGMLAACAVMGDRLVRVRGGMAEVRILALETGEEQVLPLALPPEMFLPWAPETRSLASPKFMKIIPIGPDRALLQLLAGFNDAPPQNAWALVDLSEGVLAVTSYISNDQQLVGSDPDAGLVIGLRHNIDGSATLQTFRLGEPGGFGGA